MTLISKLKNWKKILFGICLSLIPSCGSRYEIHKPVERDVISHVKHKYETYVKLAQPDLHDCDSLLFTSLIEAARKDTNIIDSFRNSDGQWFRRPSMDCYDLGQSKSTISRDMFIGLAWYIWSHKRLDLAEQVIEYANDHSLRMGQGEASRIFFSPSIYATFLLLREHLGGDKAGVRGRIPLVVPSEKTGFVAHLYVLHAMLRKELTGKFNEDAAYEIAKQNPQNALFQLAAGNEAKAADLLLNKDWWPDDRLPTSDDRCSPWIIQREYSDKNWKGCSEGKTHTGGDFLFTAWLLLRIQ